MSSISRTSGSLMGGTKLNINGNGLHNDVRVMVGNSRCDVTQADGTSLECITSPITKLHYVNNSGLHTSQLS